MQFANSRNDREETDNYASDRLPRGEVQFVQISSKHYDESNIRVERFRRDWWAPAGRQINDVAKAENSSTSTAIYHLPDEIIFGWIIFLRGLACELCHTQRVWQIKASEARRDYYTSKRSARGRRIVSVKIYAFTYIFMKGKCFRKR